MPQSGSQYSIPDQNATRASARLADQYRAQLDADRARQAREHVIDVRPTSVTVERESPSTTRRTRPAGQAVESQNAESTTGKSSAATARASRRSRASDEAAATQTSTFAYEPRTKETGVTLKSSPQERGVFVDLMA